MPGAIGSRGSTTVEVRAFGEASVAVLGADALPVAGAAAGGAGGTTRPSAWLETSIR